MICRTQGSGVEQRERGRQRARINCGSMSEEDRQRRRARQRERRRNFSEERRQWERVRAMENRQNLAKNVDKQKESGLGKTDKIVAKNAEKPESVLRKTDKIVAKNAEKRKEEEIDYIGNNEAITNAKEMYKGEDNGDKTTELCWQKVSKMLLLFLLLV